MIVFESNCKCDVNDFRLSLIKSQYLATVNSVLDIYNSWCRELEGVEFVSFDNNYVFEVLVNNKKIDVSAPLVVGTNQWIFRERGVFKYGKQEMGQELTWEMSCGFCKPHIDQVPTTMVLNGTTMFQQFYSIIDSRRPHTSKVGDLKIASSSCFINSILVSCKNEQGQEYVSENEIFTRTGSLGTQRVFPITSTFVRKLSQLISFAKNGTLSSKQALVESEKLISGNIETIFSKRGGYLSQEDYEDNGSLRLVAAFEKSSSRYQQLKTTSIQRLQFPLTIFKLIAKTSHNILSNRLFHPCEEGFLSIGYVTESDNTGQQSTMTLGIEFTQREETWDHVKKLVDSKNKFLSRVEKVLWGNEMEMKELAIPVDPIHRFLVFKDTRVDFTLFCKDVFYISAFDSTLLTTLLFTNIKMTCITVDYFRRIEKLNLLVPNLGLLEQVIPCITNSHSPKVMQSIYHIKQAIDVFSKDASPKESSKMFASNVVTCRPVGCSINNIPTIKTKCEYRPTPFNDEDGVEVTHKYISKLKNINYRTVAIITSGNLPPSFKTICCSNTPLYQQEVIMQVKADRIVLSNNYLKTELVGKQLWNILFNKEYSNKQVFVKDIQQHERVITISLQSFHQTSVGDKMTTLHGQKCTISNLKENSYEDMVISATCLKRLPLGEVIHGHVSTLVDSNIVDPILATNCFGYQWIFSSIKERASFFKTILSKPVNVLTFSILRLVQESESTLSFANVENVVRDGWVNQNMKGLSNTGASSITLPGLQSLELSGQTWLEYLIRLSVEDPNSYSLVDDVWLNKSAFMSLTMLSQFNAFNMSFNK